MEYRYYKMENITESEFSQIMEIEKSSDEGYSEAEMLSIWVTGNRIDNFVCSCDEKIVGHISFNRNSKRRNGSIYMVNLTVAPKYRRKGIARNLIKTACEYYLKEKEVKPMSLQVDKTNTAAIDLYKQVGYEIKQPICDADAEDEQYIMAASLEKMKVVFEKTIEK